jgi:hypothetical protein
VSTRRTGTTARYHAEVTWPDGRRTDEVLGAATGDLPDGALVLDDGERRVAVWRLPHDPLLPGLAAALDRRAVADLLADLGLGAGPVQLHLRAYRPTRRAVVEAVGAQGRVFLKVVRPDRVEGLHRRHRCLVEAGVPAPQSIGWTRTGLLALQALPGPTLRQRLGQPGPLPSGSAVVELLDRIPEGAVDRRDRPSWLEQVHRYAAATARVLPDVSDPLDRVVAAVAAEGGTGPRVPVHGDLYDDQLLVDGPRITGLLDVDTLRWGDRLDDLACLLGHLSVLAHHEPRRARAIDAAGARYLATFDRLVDPGDLRLRTAAVVVSLATGPHRVQQAAWERHTRALVGLAERWVASARSVRG